MHNVQVTPLIGLPQFNGWSQVVVNHDLTVTVALSVSGQNAGNIGRDLVAQIKETSPSSVETFYRLLQDLKLDTEELGVVLALSAAYVTESDISYATLRGTVILKRGDKVGKVVSSDDQIQLIQGKTQDDDVVVLATQAAGSFLGEIQQKATQGYSPDVIIKSLAPTIHKEPDTAALSIGFMIFEPAADAVPETLPGSEVEVDQEAEFERLRNQVVAERVAEAEQRRTLERDPEPMFEAPVARFEAQPPPEVPADPVPKPYFERQESFDEPEAEVPPPTSFGVEIRQTQVDVETTTTTHVTETSFEVEPSVVPESNMSPGTTADIPVADPVTPPRPSKPPGPTLGQRLAPVGETLKKIGRGLFIAAAKLQRHLKRKPPTPPAPAQLAAHAGVLPTTLIAEAADYDIPDSKPLETKHGAFGHAPPVYVAQEGALTKRRLLIVTVLILICIAGGVMIWRQRQGQQVQAAQADLVPLLSEFATAQHQVDSDPVAARARMQEILNQIEQLKKKYEQQTAAQATIDDQLGQVRATYDTLSGKEDITDLNVFFDMAQVQTGFLATKLVSDGQFLVALDQEKKELLRLNLADKSPKLLTITDLPTRPSFNLTQNQMLMLGGGVRQFDITQDEITFSQVVPEGDSNRDGTLIGRFSNYVYVLNPEKRNIFRYLIQDDSASEPIGWVKPGQPLPFENMNSFKIDGDIWMTTTEGEIIKFTSGDKQEFAITGLAKPFESAIILDTREDVANLYILEPAAKRVVVLSKTGQFIKEVTSLSLATASDIVVDESRGLILVLSGSLIFQIPI